MNTVTPISEASAELARILDAYLAARQAGESPSKQALLAEHPELADELEDCLASLEFIGAAVSPAVAGQAADTGVGSVAISAQPIGDFRLVREIGRGGMGVVYEAIQLSLSRRVALKVLPFAAVLDPQQVKRFKNEAQAAASLDHPNIVSVYSVGCERGIYYYAMQYVEGQSLAEVVEEERARSKEQGARSEELDSLPLPPGQGRGEGAETVPIACSPTLHAPCSLLPAPSSREYFRTIARLGIQAAEALDHAHASGILHRDIKPANLLVDDTGKLWITDFGLARMEQNAGMTMTGDLLGTLRYMSPEQALAKRVVVDHRSDVYSLGVTLYELLTLQPAFTGDDRQELLRQIAFDDPRPPRQINSRIPEDFETIVLKAIEKEPADRYESAQELADDLRRFVADEPIQARPARPLQRLAKWSRRHVAVVWSAAAAFLVSTLVLAASSLQIAKWYQQAEVSAQKAAAAAEAEKLAKETAQEREAAARAILDFVETKIFAAAQPEGEVGGLGHDVTLRRALESALPFVETSFTDQPLIEARLRGTLGIAFHNLGDAATAAEQFEKARALFTQHLGPDDPDTRASMNNLAQNYAALGQYADAVELHEESLARTKAALGPHHADTLLSMRNLAISYRLLGRYADAIKLHEETLALAKTKLGPDHRETLANMNGLANVYHDVGRYADAINLQEETLRLTKTRFGPDHPDTVDAMHNLAVCYHQVARYADALKLQEEALALRKAKLGPDHRKTLSTMNSLAISYAHLGRHADSVKLHEETLALQQAKLGLDNPDTLLSMGNLAASYADVGRHADALKLFEESLALTQAKLGPDHPDTLRSMSNLACELVTCVDSQLRDPPRAVELAKRAVELTPNDGIRWSILGVAYYRTGDWQAAVHALEKSMELRNGGDSSDWFFLAMAHWRLGHKDDARKWYEQGAAWMEKNNPDNEELRRIRVEAAELLGISEPQSSEPEHTENKIPNTVNPKPVSTLNPKP